MPLVHYLTHPQVHIDAEVEVTDWGLSDVGAARLTSLLGAPALLGVTRIVSSAERKAMETATLLAADLGLSPEIRAAMHENDRSATGFLPPEQFEVAADAFFAAPDESYRGWETARAAQHRIVSEVNACLASQGDGDLLLVGHGGVGTLLYCALAGLPVDRCHDQARAGGAPGGGNYFAFDSESRQPLHGWRPLEALVGLAA
ncbi:MAG: histidine phosphatase family protein [Rhodobacteraceae bacterium]|nr:histidine phosphatase family protein [Paracoccaceae bacterium]MBR9823098.1 histidine phosphatase family protein [Paracoccaceae bacterium]